MKKFLSRYSLKYPVAIVYMLQSTEYKAPEYLAWLNRVTNFRQVMYRRVLDKTKVARLLLLAVRVGIVVQIVIGLLITGFGISSVNYVIAMLGLIIILTYPFVWAYLLVVPLQLGRWFIINPRYRKQIRRSEKIFASSKAHKIAVAGSYGKTSMKELLKTVLSEGKKVAATPENKNVAISHARFANKLKGDEEVLIIEFGEEEPGDVAAFAKITHPDIGVITGLAPAHLNSYETLAAAGADIFSLADYVGPDQIFVNTESESVNEFMKSEFVTYNSKNALGWEISNIKIDFSGTSFEMKKGDEKIVIHSGLMGRHQVGPLACVAGLAHKLGLSKEQIEKGVGKTEAYEHRMQPRQIAGAWVIDDTYNGNIEGMKAGLKLLEQLPGKRKIYVTPGLVDQGEENERVHLELGQAIAAAKPDKVVLMYNSATRFIQNGLDVGSYKGDVQIEHYPLDYYTNLEHILAAGDVVLMQNDWTDNYS